MNYINFKTDMADERVDEYKKVNNLSEIDGIIVSEEIDKNLKTVTVEVVNENGERALNKEIGKYITLEIDNVRYLEEEDKLLVINKIFEKLKELIETKETIMVIGLGNVHVTPDALGPKVVKNLDITRHLIKFAKEYIKEDTKELSAIAPGVLGTTGIETFEIVESIVNKVNPELIIVIDSLASSSMDRLGKTVQLSNKGITPGAGVKNTRIGINESSLNIPVVAIGVPTVVDMATITNEAFNKLLRNKKDEIDNFTNSNIENSNIIFDILNEENRYNIIANTLNTENYIVTPKEIDEIIAKTSDIISNSINNLI